MGALIVLATLSSQRHLGEVRVQLDLVDSESFRIADYFRRTLRELNNTMTRYGVSHEPAEWAVFLETSTNLDLWIDKQKPKLKTTRLEKEILEQIDHAYDDYQRVAGEVRAKVRAAGGQPISLAEFADFEAESQRLFALGWSLADAHRTRRAQLVSDARQTTDALQRVQLGSLALVFLAGLGLAGMVYRDMIAPLRLKLVESRALVERQEKLASLGVLAAGIAHEIRNPLTAIKAVAFLQQRKSPPASQELADAQLLLREI